MDAASLICTREAQLLTCGSSTLRSLYGMDSWWVMMCLSPCTCEAEAVWVAAVLPQQQTSGKQCTP